MVGFSEINGSYFYAIDTRYGWGNISYFTFLSEFNRSWKGHAYIEASIMTILFVLSIIGNVFFIGFMFHSKQSRTITNYFVCNLALADVFFSSSGPFIAYIRLTPTWSLGDGMCHILNYEMFVCGFVMIWTMAIISIDRFVCINLTVPSSRRLKPRHVVIICVCIWIVALLCFLPIAIYFNLKDITVSKGELSVISFCSLVWPKSNFRYSIFFACCLLLIAFVIPLTVIIINYFRIFKKFWTSKRTIAVTKSSSIRTTQPSFRGTKSRRTRNMRIVKTLVMLVLLFVLMWFPLFLTFGLITYDTQIEKNAIPSHALIWTLIVAYVNPCINPFLYGLINAELKRGLIACCKCKQTEESLITNNGNGNSFTLPSDYSAHI